MPRPEITIVGTINIKKENNEIKSRSAMYQINVISSIVNFVSLKQVSGKFNRLFDDLDKFNANNKCYLNKSDCIEKGEDFIYSDFESFIVRPNSHTIFFCTQY